MITINNKFLNCRRLIQTAIFTNVFDGNLVWPRGQSTTCYKSTHPSVFYVLTIESQLSDFLFYYDCYEEEEDWNFKKE